MRTEIHGMSTQAGFPKATCLGRLPPSDTYIQGYVFNQAGSIPIFHLWLSFFGLGPTSPAPTSF
ncbi:hypothetical protein LSAT2_031890, partial [Lamellibrachia satsuma]